MGLACMLLGRHGTCRVLQGTCADAQAAGHGHAGIQGTNAKAQSKGGGGGGRRSVPEELDLGQAGAEELRWGARAWLSSLFACPFRDHVFSFDLRAQEEGEGLVPTKVRGWVGGRAGRGTRPGKECLTGVTGVGRRIQKGDYRGAVRAAPGFPLFHFLQYLTWRSQDVGNCAVRGKLTVRCWRGGGHPPPQLCPALCPLLSLATEGNVQERG